MVDLIAGPVIVTKYCCQTDSSGSRILAIHRRGSETVWRHYHNYDQGISSDENHLAAAEGLLASWPYIAALKIIARGYDAKGQYFVCRAF